MTGENDGCTLVTTGMEASSSPTARASKFYVGPVHILSGLVKFPITSTQIMGPGSRLWGLDIVVRPVDKKVSLHVCGNIIYLR